MQGRLNTGAPKRLFHRHCGYGKRPQWQPQRPKTAIHPARYMFAHRAGADDLVTRQYDRLACRRRTRAQLVQAVDQIVDKNQLMLILARTDEKKTPFLIPENSLSRR